MELNPPDRQRLMPDSHDFAFGPCLGDDLQRIRDSRTLDQQRMIARGIEGTWQPPKQRVPIMMDRRCLAVHQTSRPDHFPAKNMPDALVAQTDAQSRDC